MSNSFFAGLEAFMDENPVEATATVTIQPEENIEEVSEADAAATEQGETSAEIQEETAKAEMVFAKYAELDRMIAHVEKYGVDRTFLSLCNHNNMLSNTIGMNLPACESFDSVGSSTSAVSIAALEGLKETASKVWEFIKRMCLRMKDWIVRIVKMYDFRFNSVEKRAKALQKLCGTNTEKRDLTDEDKDKLKDIEVYNFSSLDWEFSKIFNGIKRALGDVKTMDELNGIDTDSFELGFKMPEKVSLNDILPKLDYVDDFADQYSQTALEIVDSAKKMLNETLPSLRKDVEKLKSDANSKKIDEETAKLQFAKNKLLIKAANESIGEYLKLGNAAVASGSIIQSKLFQKPGAKGTK